LLQVTKTGLSTRDQHEVNASLCRAISGSHVRIDVKPIEVKGLRRVSAVIIDKLQAIAGPGIRPAIGRLDDDSMLAGTRSLAVFLGFA
jgi:hypothetical protein